MTLNLVKCFLAVALINGTFLNIFSLLKSPGILLYCPWPHPILPFLLKNALPSQKHVLTVYFYLSLQDAHDIILDFIRSRPPLAPAESRKLNPLPESNFTPRDKLMEELNQGESITERLKPVPKAKPTPSEQNGRSFVCMDD